MDDKIVLLASYPDSIVNFRMDLIDDLLKIGKKVYVIAPGISKSKELVSILNDKGIYFYDVFLSRTGVNPIKDGVTIIHLIFILLKIRPKFFLSYTIKPVIYGGFAAFFCRVPNRHALITGLGFAFSEEKSNGYLSKIKDFSKHLYKFSLKLYNGVFFQNNDDKDLFLKLKLVSENKPITVVNGSGINIDRFCFRKIENKDISFLLISRLLKAKGILEYLAAAELLKDKYPSVDFKLVGWFDDGNPDSISPKLLDRLVDEKIINYLGKLSDVRTALAESSVYVLPSYREGTPRTVLEAMSIGRPVITTDAPGCKDTVDDAYNGFIVPVKNIELLSVAMERFILNPDLIDTMGLNARNVVENKYDVRKVNEVMLRKMGVI